MPATFQNIDSKKIMESILPFSPMRDVNWGLALVYFCQQKKSHWSCDSEVWTYDGLCDWLIGVVEIDQQDSKRGEKVHPDVGAAIITISAPAQHSREHCQASQEAHLFPVAELTTKWTNVTSVINICCTNSYFSLNKQIHGYMVRENIFPSRLNI